MDSDLKQNGHISTETVNDEQKSYKKVMCPANMSKAVVNVKYAVRGKIVQRAYEIQSDLKENKNKVKNEYNS